MIYFYAQNLQSNFEGKLISMEAKIIYDKTSFKKDLQQLREECEELAHSMGATIKNQ